MALIPWTQTDFSGGMTDAILGASQTQAEILDNFLITAIERKAKGRDGSVILDGNVVSTVKPDGKTGDLINFLNETSLLIRVKGKIYVKPVSTWGAITGPAGHDVFTTATPLTENTIATFDESGPALYLTAADFSQTPVVYASPQKIFRDATGTHQVLNAGLPKFPDGLDPTNRATLLATALTFANTLKANLVLHFAQVHTTITATVASPTVFTLAAHGFSELDVVYLDSTGTLPTGLSQGFKYVRNPTTNTFQLSTTSAGSLLNATTSGTGTMHLKSHVAAHSYSFVADATDEDTLITLTKDLWAALTAHVQDARQNFSAYHPVAGAGSFGNYYPRPMYSVSTLPECVAVLNDLKTVYNIHVLSFNLLNTSLDFPVHGSQRFLLDDAYLQITTTPVFGSVVPLTNITDFAELLRVEMNTHYADISGAGGHLVADGYHSISSSMSIDPAADYPTMVVQLWRMLFSYSLHRLDVAAGSTGAGFHGAATEDTGTALAGIDATLPSAPWYQVVRVGQLYAYRHDSVEDWQAIYDAIFDLYTKLVLHVARGGSSPNDRHISTGGTITLTDVIEECTFSEGSYAFTYKNSYLTEGGTLFEDVSSPAFVTAPPYISHIKYPGSSTLSVDFLETQTYGPVISQIPALSSDENHPYLTVSKEIWRTKLNGVVYYKLNELGNSYYTSPGDDLYDGTSDTDLSTETLYVTGGVVANDPPPKCVAFWVTGNRGFYGGSVEVVRGVEVPFPKRVRQAIADDPDSVPETFFVDLPANFVCGGTASAKPVAVTDRGVFRLEGGFDELGQGSLVAESISETVGGASPRGGVSLDDVYYFAGTDGFYMTDGYKVLPISTHLKKTTYPAIVATAARRRDIQCKLDRTNRRIYWTANQGSTGYADVLFVLDLNQPIDVEQACFTRLTGGTNFAPTAIEFFGGLLHRGDYQGFVFKHTSGTLTDPKITRAAGGSLSGDISSIPWQYRSAAQSMNSDLRKWFTEAALEFRNTGNLTVLPRSINDLNTGNIRDMRTLRVRGTYAGNISEDLKFPASASGGTRGGFRATYKQIDLTPGTAIIISSDDSSPITLASVSGATCTLDTSVYDWPADCEDWTISFESDGYLTQYTILDRVSGDTLSLSGSPGFSGSKKWQIRGTPKDESVEILAVSMFYQMLTDQGLESSQGVTGANT